jgi:hypothetical protein
MSFKVCHQFVNIENKLYPLLHAYHNDISYDIYDKIYALVILN